MAGRARRSHEGRLAKVRGGSGTVRVLGLPGVAELGHRCLLAGGQEDRVVAEPLRAPRLARDAALEHTASPQLLAAGPEQHELADVARPPVLDRAQLAQQPLDRLAALGPEARRAHPRRSPERRDLEPRVLAEHPRVGRPDLPPVERFGPRVVDVALVALFGVVLGVEQGELPAERRQLPQLVPVARAEQDPQSHSRDDASPSGCDGWRLARTKGAFVPGRYERD
jgi:hypothetical protein